MRYDLDKHKRRSIRLKGYDYSAPGAYFITVCTHQRQCLFGQVVAGQMELNATGLWVQACWQRLPHQFSGLTLDVFVFMPNHMHGILWLGDTPCGDGGDICDGGDTPCGDGDHGGGADICDGGDAPRKGEAFGHQVLKQPKVFQPNASPLPTRTVTPISPATRMIAPTHPIGTTPGSIAAIIQNFKSISTRRINQLQWSAGRTIWQRNYYEHIIRDERALQNIQNYILNNPLAWEKDQLHPNR